MQLATSVKEFTFILIAIFIIRLFFMTHLLCSYFINRHFHHFASFRLRFVYF